MKRRLRNAIGVVASLAIMFVLFSGFSASPRTVRPIGDVNEDRGVTSADARLLVRHIVSGNLPESAKWASDCDQNGTVDTADARMVLTRAMLETPVSAAGEDLPLTSYYDVSDEQQMSAYEMVCELTDT